MLLDQAKLDARRCERTRDRPGRERTPLTRERAAPGLTLER
jgi:hypothetical protein